MKTITAGYTKKLTDRRRNWIRHLFGLFWVVVVVPVAVGVVTYGDFALAWFLLGVGIAVFALVASQAAFMAGAVLAFRVGGWEQVLRDRDRDLAWKEQLKDMLGDEDRAADGRFAGFWRRVRRAG